jgi:isopenicillin N synthase-like dioxygenase
MFTRRSGSVRQVVHLLNRSVTSFINIPTVDIGPLVRNGSEQEQQAAGNALHEACIDVGFFYIKNHGKPLADLTSLQT